MAEPSVAAGTVVAAGLTVFGISTGLDPAILIAGLAGGLWAQTYYPPTPLGRRAALVILAAILAGYLAPIFAALAASFEIVRTVFAPGSLHPPFAVLVGLTSHRVLGPAVMRFAAKKAGELTK